MSRWPASLARLQRRIRFRGEEDDRHAGLASVRRSSSIMVSPSMTGMFQVGDDEIVMSGPGLFQPSRPFTASVTE